MASSLKRLRTNTNLWDGVILFICICIALGIIFIRPKPLLYEALFVPVKVSVFDEEFKKIENVKVYGISTRDKDRDNRKIGPIKRLMLSLPKAYIANFKQVRVSLGDKHFFYTRQQLLQNWKRIGSLLTGEKIVTAHVNFLSPSDLKTNSILNKMDFLWPLLKNLINGNPENLNLIKECALFYYTPVLYIALILFLIFAMISNNKNNYVSMILPKACYNQHKKFCWVHIAFVFILTFTIASFFSRFGIDVHHQGFLFQVAARMSEGKMLFKDVYFHYGALTAILQALAIGLFGKSLIVIQVETALFYALTSIFLWLVWSRFMQPILATISCVTWLCLAPYFESKWIFHPWSSVHSLFFLTLSLYILILALEKRKLRYLYLSGMTVSLTFWCKQPEGILLFLSILSFVFILYVLEKSDVKVTLKRIGVFLAGNLTISIVFLAWLLINDGVQDWWLQCFGGAASWAFGSAGGGLVDKVVSAVKAFFPKNCWQLFPLFAFLILFSIIFKIVNKEKVNKQSEILLAILIISLVNCLNYYPVPCPRHIYWAATPLVGFFTFYLLCSWKLFMKFCKSKKIAFSLGLFLFIILSITIIGHEIINKIDHGIKKAKNYSYKVTKPDVLSGMMVASKRQVTALKKLDSAVQSYLTIFPETSLISLSNSNMLFLTIVDNNKMFSPFQTPSMGRKFYPKIYKYLGKLFKHVGEKKSLIFADRPKMVPGYYKIANILTMRLCPEDKGTWYLYAPILKYKK